MKNNPLACWMVPILIQVVLARPDDRSITLSLMPDQTVEAFVTWSRDTSGMENLTHIFSLQAQMPTSVKLENLDSNSAYYYEVLTRDASGTFIPTVRGQFQTARKPGVPFSFAVIADPHLDDISNPATFSSTLSNILREDPDFLIELGDNFMTDKLPVISYPAIVARALLYRQYYGKVTHEIPLFMMPGNHEGEAGWQWTADGNNMAAWNTLIRKKYFPGPGNTHFYSGDPSEYPFIGLRESYYAWTWGDALFVVIDPYWNTLVKPGREVDGWGWTLGEAQYRWFARVLQSSPARFKFVFAHHLVGGSPEGRGGTEWVPFFEMGGYHSNNTYEFDLRRPGWGKPLHPLMVENGVTVFFHGHDHLYVRQEIDGIVYQLVPQPSVSNYSSIAIAAKYGYQSGTILPPSGHLNISVTPDSVWIGYLRGYHPAYPEYQRNNGKVEYSYIIRQKTSSRASLPNHPPDVPEISVRRDGSEGSYKFNISKLTGDTLNLRLFDLSGSLIRDFGLLSSNSGEYELCWDPGKEYHIPKTGKILLLCLTNKQHRQCKKFIFI